MKRVEKILEISPDTLAALERLAKITGAESGVGELIQDALRVFEWAVYQQANKRQVISIPQDSLAKMDVPPDARMLEPLLDENAIGDAKQFFKAA